MDLIYLGVPVVCYGFFGRLAACFICLFVCLLVCLFVCLLVCLFVCLFVVITPENPYFAFRLGLEVKLLGVFGPRSSSCGPTCQAAAAGSVCVALFY